MYKVSFLVLVAIALSACNSKTVSDADFPVESVMLAQYTEPSDTTLYYNIENSAPLVVQIINTPLPDTTFNGVPVKSTKSQTITRQGETEMERTESILYFQESPLKYIGSVSSDEYEVASNQTPMPKKAKIGDSGDVNQSNLWTDASKKTQTSDMVAKWSLKPANDNTAWLCEDLEIYYLAEEDTDTKGSSCVEINPNGDILKSKMIVNSITDDQVQEFVFVSK